MAEASRIAKAGEDAPLLGGHIGLMWGVLITSVLTYQYLVLSQTIGMPLNSLAFAWIAFGVIGGLGSMILGRAIDKKPGANSIGNKIEGYVWTMFAGTMGALVVGSILNMVFGNGNQTVWNTVLVFSFAGQGLVYGVMGKVTKTGLLHLASFASFVLSAITFMWVDRVEIYLIGAIGAALTIVIPNLILNARAR